VHSVPINTKVVSLNPAHGEMYSIPQYVIKFVSDFQQVSGFLRVIPVTGNYILSTSMDDKIRYDIAEKLSSWH
jgi:hypothetical protein